MLQELNRDEAVCAFAATIASADGLRAGLDAMVRLVEDARASIAVTPLPWRRDTAARIAHALGVGPAPVITGER